ncbi:VOC family protein [Streptomyces calidiresistens]|uniref:Glyoxalase n=1 Tax=Streptomyces calidiresistens TaxID=1485586 RepID=A0A7W3XYT4_9ACTN|nr:VOC family protein [Streptomyces calidiresistens]MBB0232490.1 glyoxalase [Streptomyces calidiresistens]
MTPRVDMVGFVTADLPASLAFYRRLGIDVPPDAEGPHVEATLPGGVRVAWDTEEMMRSLAPEWTPPTGSPRMVLAFHCGTPAGVDALYAELTSARPTAAERPPWDAPWGQRYAVVRDPDGIPVDLFAPLTEPTDEAPATEPPPVS